jgi:hypothetical protein
VISKKKEDSMEIVGGCCIRWLVALLENTAGPMLSIRDRGQGLCCLQEDYERRQEKKRRGSYPW